MAMNEKPQKRFTVTINPELYTAAGVAAKLRGVNVGEVLDEALAAHQGVRNSLKAIAFAEGGSEVPDAPVATGGAK